jgi:NADPH:quinone reductase-like Zn-dependent oxidoreductase
VRGFHLSYQLIPHSDRLAAALSYISPRVESGIFRPRLSDKRFTLDQIAEAYRYMESNEHIGKIIVTNESLCRGSQVGILNDAVWPEVVVAS